MNLPKDPLLRHLMVAVAIKLIALAAIWFTFVQGTAVPVNADRTASQFRAEQTEPNPGTSK